MRSGRSCIREQMGGPWAVQSALVCALGDVKFLLAFLWLLCGE